MKKISKLSNLQNGGVIAKLLIIPTMICNFINGAKAQDWTYSALHVGYRYNRQFNYNVLDN